jgi:uncharacterized protein YjiS (DUF1127 family)
MTRAALLSLPATLTLQASLRGLAARLALMPALHRQRRALAALDDRLLADIGVTRAEALAELDAPIWDAPRHWRG